LKAGIMEIADLYVVNKADREGADRAAGAIEALLALQTFDNDAWRPPVLSTEATSGVGIGALLDAVERFLTQTAGQRGARRRLRAGVRVKDLVARRLLAYVEQEVLTPGEFEALLDHVAARDIDPHAVADALVARLRRRP
ncbi:MAG: methylmalonyl Co-A mutase-associated GTPase MeaB, partial [Candidatus Limnocylindrales bacterium]